MRNICLLDSHEAEELRAGKELDCRKHRHLTREQARGLVLGNELVPWLRGENWKPEARWATLADGSISQRHVVRTQAWEWMKVTERTRVGARGYSTMQLVPQASSRRI